ncbi:apolipoprotein N-acyltransferase [Prolixibacter bellariivorans]|uniref:Apolipoprotein N-acyltransferase n=1 Tax=Prolixibacter bellariivorans TaxID=314319 RepID=A0A5M4AWE4_9BACT|nr:nitrilase-related carbon-nitrogen hydrolase [Prolixibacter bellariivorans]GET32249.1 apolipoprotein N-acyltransferase [Prolixibacter bellariivorans]
MKIATVQFAPVLGNLDATIAKLRRLLEEAATADLVVLPELANSGYAFSSREEARSLSENVGESNFLSFLTEECWKHHFAIATGFNERDGDKLFNSAILLDSEGVIGAYRKAHLFLNEKDIFEPGDTGFPVFSLGDIRVGMLICFDWVFPEAWRIMGLKGADIVCHPSNLVLPELAQRTVPAHAVTNRYFVALANRVGKEKELTFTGNSLICGTKGEILAEAEATSEQVLMATIDPLIARDKSLTKRNNWPSDRRPELYREEGLTD